MWVLRSELTNYRVYPVSGLPLQFILIKDATFAGCFYPRSYEKELYVKKSQGIAICMLAPGSSGIKLPITPGMVRSVTCCPTGSGPRHRKAGVIETVEVYEVYLKGLWVDKDVAA